MSKSPPDPVKLRHNARKAALRAMSTVEFKQTTRFLDSMMAHLDKLKIEDPKKHRAIMRKLKRDTAPFEISPAESKRRFLRIVRESCVRDGLSRKDIAKHMKWVRETSPPY